MPSGKSGSTGRSANWFTMSAQLPVKPRQSAAEGQLPPSGPLSRMATTSAQQLTAFAASTYQQIESAITQAQAARTLA